MFFMSSISPIEYTHTPFDYEKYHKEKKGGLANTAHPYKDLAEWAFWQMKFLRIVQAVGGEWVPIEEGEVRKMYERMYQEQPGQAATLVDQVRAVYQQYKPSAFNEKTFGCAFVARFCQLRLHAECRLTRCSKKPNVRPLGLDVPPILPTEDPYQRMADLYFLKGYFSNKIGLDAFFQDQSDVFLNSAKRLFAYWRKGETFDERKALEAYVTCFCRHKLSFSPTFIPIVSKRNEFTIDWRQANREKVIERFKREGTPIPPMWHEPITSSRSRGDLVLLAAERDKPYRGLARQWIRYLAVTPHVSGASDFVSEAREAFRKCFGEEKPFSEKRLLDAYIKEAFRYLHQRYAFEDSTQPTDNGHVRPWKESALHILMCDMKMGTRSWQIDEEATQDHIAQAVESARKTIPRDFAQFHKDDRLTGLLQSRLDPDYLNRIAKKTLQACWEEYGYEKEPMKEDPPQPQSSPRPLPRAPRCNEIERLEEKEGCRPAPIDLDELVAGVSKAIGQPQKGSDAVSPIDLDELVADVSEAIGQPQKGSDAVPPLIDESNQQPLDDLYEALKAEGWTDEDLNRLKAIERKQNRGGSLIDVSNRQTGAERNNSASQLFPTPGPTPGQISSSPIPIPFPKKSVDPYVESSDW
ncbi:MAG: hypothetical protein KGR16_06410 [Verrucomicrobia bacterium]|nr:hypothetical protein [Verrucomicrobiota bacterium]